MPLREDLLTPIAGDNPSGTSLRYDRVYDQIKEARTEEDDSLPSGAWARTAKRADFRVVTKLAGDALATRSKDLQLLVWLGEALLKQEGVAALAPLLRLTIDLQREFWETLHPEVDEGDAGMRAAPLQWAATRYAKLVHQAGLTRKGIGFLEYKAARAIGTEDEASSNPQKQKLREEAVAAGRVTVEDVDEAIAATPKAFYVTLEESLTQSLQALSELDLFCEERYGVDDAPSFRTLRQALEEVQNLASSLLREKRKLEPDAIVEDSEPEEPEELEAAPVAAEDTSSSIGPEPLVAVAVRKTRSGSLAATPESWEDALQRIDACLAYMSTQQPESALPFLLRSCMRTGELLQMADDGRLNQLAAPPTELRQALKRAASQGEWSELHGAALAAMASPCACGWLDLYRYLWMSCYQLGWSTQQQAIVGAVQQKVQQVSALPTLTLDDDTPTANADTMRWIAEEIAPPAEPPSPCEACARAAEATQPTATPKLEALLTGERERAEAREEEDLFATARGMAAHGQVQGAIQLLARDAAHQSVGRLRYGRNLQIAELCLESGNSAVAVPVLQGLVREVEERRLESWEPPESAAKPYALLLQCAAVAKLDTQTIFARLCAIDPGAALTMAPPVET